MKFIAPKTWVQALRTVGTLSYVYERLGIDAAIEVTCKSCRLKKVPMTLPDLREHVQAHYFLSKLDEQAVKYLAGRTKKKRSKHGKEKPSRSHGRREQERPMPSAAKSSNSKS